MYGMSAYVQILGEDIHPLVCSSLFAFKSQAIWLAAPSFLVAGRAGRDTGSHAHSRSFRVRLKAGKALVVQSRQSDGILMGLLEVPCKSVVVICCDL